jgi:hypothetical protein
MQDKTAYIDFILDCLKSGIVERKDIMAKFGEKWQTPPRTFDRYLQKANEAYKIEREAIQKEKAKETISLEIETAKTQIYDKAKMIQDLESDIESMTELLKKGYILKKFNIEGKEEIKKEIFGVKEIESLNRIKDSKYEILKKMQGWDAPKQVENNNKYEDLIIKGIIIQ